MRIIFLLLAIALLGYLVLKLSRRASPGTPTNNGPRELSRSEQQTSARLETIDDPRIAATAMMAAIADYGGEITPQLQTAIVEQATQYFSIDEPTANKLLTRAHSAVRGTSDLDHCLTALAPTIRQSCTPDERNDLLDMLAEVASHCPDASSTSIGNALARLRNQIN